MESVERALKCSTTVVLVCRYVRLVRDLNYGGLNCGIWIGSQLGECSAWLWESSCCFLVDCRGHCTVHSLNSGRDVRLVDTITQLVSMFERDSKLWVEGWCIQFVAVVPQWYRTLRVECGRCVDVEHDDARSSDGGARHVLGNTQAGEKCVFPGTAARYMSWLFL